MWPFPLLCLQWRGIVISLTALSVALDLLCKLSLSQLHRWSQHKQFVLQYSNLGHSGPFSGCTDISASHIRNGTCLGGEVTMQANWPNLQSVGVQDFQKSNLTPWRSWRYCVVNFSDTSGTNLTQKPLGTGEKYPPLPATADKDSCLTKVLREIEATPDKTSFKRL